MQAGDGVIPLVAVPPVPSGDGKLQRTLQRNDDEDRHSREHDRRLLCGPVRHDPTKPRTSEARFGATTNRFVHGRRRSE
jgi:hypothetical protein